MFDPVIRELKEQQVRFAPRDVQIEQIERAEKLLNEIDPQDSYLYPSICERITKFRPERYPSLKIDGHDVIHDLRRFVEDLSDSVDMPVEAVEEPVLTVEDLSKRYNVSTKTVDRWRDRGLVSRRFRFGNRKRIGFLESSVDRFVKLHGDEINRSSKFTQLSESEREDIVKRARRMARYGGCPSEISRRLSKRMSRSAETIRYTLKNHDKDHPHSAVFPKSVTTLTDEHKTKIFRSFRRGIPVEKLANQYCRTKGSIYRIISEIRVQRLLEQPIDFMDNEEFHKKNAAEFILQPPPEVERKSRAIKPPPGLPPYLASLYSIPLLTREEEQHYFRKMNFYKFQAHQLREKLDPDHPKTKEMDQIEKHLDQYIEVKNFLIRSNLRLVVSIAKKHIKPGANFFGMVSDGNMSLIRALEKFDYSRGNKFSTYATWAIMRNFARSIPQEYTILERYRTGTEEIFQSSTDERANQFQEELVNRKQRQVIMNILEQLDEREKNIIMQRFGLEQGTEPCTLAEVGSRFGVTKERIRQLEARALRKLQKIATDEKLDIPGLED